MERIELRSLVLLLSIGFAIQRPSIREVFTSHVLITTPRTNTLYFEFKTKTTTKLQKCFVNLKFGINWLFNWQVIIEYILGEMEIPHITSVAIFSASTSRLPFWPRLVWAGATWPE